MKFGISVQGVIPVRSEPSHRAEMVTQVLFGELFRIHETEEPWCRVSLVDDQYEGWIHQLQVQFLEEEEFIRLERVTRAVSLDFIQLVVEEGSGQVIPVPLGCSFPGFSNGQFTIANKLFSLDGPVNEANTDSQALTAAGRDALRNRITGDAMLYLNAPYLWGGRSPLGIDCSGFVQMAYRMEHIDLLRDSTMQATQGEVVSLLFESMPADLVFFDDDEGNINHVGLLLNSGTVIHCSGKVKIDPIDHEGIFCREQNRYTHKLRLIKRII